MEQEIRRLSNNLNTIVPKEEIVYEPVPKQFIVSLSPFISQVKDKGLNILYDYGNYIIYYVIVVLILFLLKPFFIINPYNKKKIKYMKLLKWSIVIYAILVLLYHMSKELY
jgi:hypothetical protein